MLLSIQVNMIYILLLLVGVAGGIFALQLIQKRRRRYLELAAKIPMYKGALPLVGHSYKLVGGSIRFWENFKDGIKEAEKAGGVLSLWAGPSLQIIINDPDDAMTVLNSCLEKSFFYKMGSGWVGDGLITASVPKWKKNRKLLNPTFSQHVLDGFLQIFNEQAILLSQDLEAEADKGYFDVRQYLTERTLETICQTAVGISLEDRSVIDTEYKEAVEKTFDLLSKRLSSFWLHPNFIYGLTSNKREEDKATAILHKMSMGVLNKRRAERQQAKLANASSRRFIAFLDLLLDMAEEGSFTDEEIREELDTMIAAGHDTTSRALMSILILIGTYPEVQEKMYQEILSVLGTSDNVTKKDLENLVYMEAVIKESLRISPVTPIIARDVTKEVKLKNYTLPVGAGCIVAFYGILRLPMWGPDAEQFRPERWFEPDSLPKSPGAYCAFSLGKRNCIGKAYAMMALKPLLVHIVRKFKIKADFSKVKMKFDLLLKHVSGHHISLERRKTFVN